MLATIQLNWERAALIKDMDECDLIATELDALPSPARRAELLQRLVSSHLVFNMELGRGSIFWRARKCDENGFPEERSLRYPPSSVAGVGRFNDMLQPSLYLSARRETALAEVGAEPGHYVQLAGFRVREAESLRILLVGEWMHLHKLGYLRIGDKAASAEMSRSINSFPLQEGRVFTYIDAILGDVMARRDASTDDYLSTRLLIKQLYAKLPTTEGILYPSVKDDLGTNLAVGAEAADRSLEICCSTVVRVDDVRRYAVHDCEPIKLATGVNSDGSFIWTVPNRPDEMILFRLTPKEAAQSPNSILDLMTQ